MNAYATRIYNFVYDSFSAAYRKSEILETLKKDKLLFRDEMLRSQVKKKDRSFDKEYFDSGNYIFGAYDYYSFHKYLSRFRPLSQLIKDHFKPKRVLDIGCAKGVFVYAFREIGVEAYGVDVSAYAISCAPTSVRPFLRVVDLEKEPLPYKDGYFDFVTFFGTIEYLNDHRELIKEIERVTANNGSLLLTTVYRKPKDDYYRINVHSKRFWLKEFSGWTIPKAYYEFMSDYFQKNTDFRTDVRGLKGLLFGKSRFSDKLLVFLWDILVTSRILGYGILLLSHSKNSGG